MFIYRNTPEATYTSRPPSTGSDIADVNNMRLRTSHQTAGKKKKRILRKLRIVRKSWEP